MKIFCKKTITLIYLLFFLFSFFIPIHQTNAQASIPLVGSLHAEQTTINNDTSTKITATIMEKYWPQIPDGYLIKFFTSAPPSSVIYGFKQETSDKNSKTEETCIITTQASKKYCYLYFSASGISDKQTFMINVGVYANTKDLPIGVTITGVEIKIQVPDTNQNTVNTDTTYTPLAPLPGLGTSFETDPTKNACPFGNYLNIMIKLILGIAAVLAMVMIVMGGIQYMTSDLVSSKEAGKETVTNAILGLLIGLGAWLILNTINPALLNACLDKLPQAEITIEEAPPTAADFSTNETIPTGSLGSCSEGITKINTSGGTFTLCNKIANSVQSTINKAWSEGYKISGWGWRSHQKQIELRTKNGCPDVYTSPPSKCRVPTAIPGRSMHETGLAIDFTCDGVGIQTRDNRCYLWLKENTTTHKLTNLKSEAWHWSTNGH